MCTAEKIPFIEHAGTRMLLCFVFLFNLLACKEPAAPNRQEETKITLPAESSKQDKRTSTCDFDHFLQDPHTPELARNIYLDQEWNLYKDDEALALLDSLTANDKAARPFYFKVVTKSYQKADGYYSEGQGMAAYAFITGHTQEFAAYFDDTACHTSRDLEDWADMVILELMISREGEYGQPVVEEFMKKTEPACQSCTSNQKETMLRFGRLLKERWKEVVKTGS